MQPRFKQLNGGIRHFLNPFGPKAGGPPGLLYTIHRRLGPAPENQLTSSDSHLT